MLKPQSCRMFQRGIMSAARDPSGSNRTLPRYGYRREEGAMSPDHELQRTRLSRRVRRGVDCPSWLAPLEEWNRGRMWRTVE